MDCARRRAGPSPAVDHRSGGLAATNACGRAERHLQWRDLQFRRAARAAGAGRRTLRHRWRYRGAAARLARLGAGAARPAERHVRLRAPRCGGGDAVSRPRPVGREAAPLCRTVRRQPRLRVRAEGPARASAAAPRARCDRDRGLSGVRLRARRRLSDRRRAQAARRPLPAGAARAKRTGAAPLVGRQLRRSRDRIDTRARRGAAGAYARGRAQPHGRRRAARRLPLGRGRQLGGRGADGGGEQGGGAHLYDRLRRGGP